MIYSNACAYGIRAMAQLAILRPDGYVVLDELCEGTGLPRHFIAKILQDLVRSGLLVSAKGRGGGFALAHSPDRITLWQIVDAIDGTERVEQCVVGLDRCNDTQPCPQHDQWQTIKTQIKTFLQETTLDRMAKTLAVKLKQAGQSDRSPLSPSKPLTVD